MILPSFQCSSKRGYRGRYFLSDRKKTLKDLLSRPKATLHHWLQSYDISYNFNSRGYRDIEWPQQNLDQYFWCLGDSLTLGLGAAIHDTWPRLLQTKIGVRCINVSMAGASNQWIYRKAINLLSYVRPSKIFILWTWLHRREKSLAELYEERWKEFYANTRDPSWPQQISWNNADKLPQHILRELRANQYWPSIDIDLADEARLRFDNAGSDQRDVDLIVKLVTDLENKRGKTQILHMFLPQVGGELHSELVGRIQRATNRNFLQVQWTDHSRDFDHFGPATAKQVANLFVANA